MSQSAAAGNSSSSDSSSTINGAIMMGVHDKTLLCTALAAACGYRPDVMPAHSDFVRKDHHYGPVEYASDGLLLACGTSTGVVLVFDTARMLLLRSRLMHTAPVTSLCWSRGGTRLVSSGGDWKCAVWDLYDKGSPHYTIDMFGPVVRVSLHPRNKNLLLVSMTSYRPVLLDLKKQSVAMLENAEIAADRQDVTSEFDQSGSFIFTGSSKGKWCVLRLPSQTSQIFDKSIKYKSQSVSRGLDDDCLASEIDEEGCSVAKTTLEVVFQDTLCGSAVRHFAQSRSGRHLAITLGDKTIRVYDLLHVCDTLLRQPSENTKFECVPVFKLQDLVSRLPWGACAWSPCEQYLAALTTASTFTLQIWARSTGYLSGILTSASDKAINLCWHPKDPTIAATSSDGTLIIWSTLSRQRWSSFAPGFRDLEANVEYVEREDEFDVDEEAEAAAASEAREKLNSIAKGELGDSTGTEPFIDLFAPCATADNDSEDPARALCVPLEVDENMHPEYFCDLAHPAMHFVRVRPEEIESKRRRRN